MRSFIGLKMLALALLIGIVAGALDSFVFACNVPVFRYALEHWRPDSYQGVLFHRGPLSASDQEKIAGLRDDPRKMAVNLSIRTVDLDDVVPPADRELLSLSASTDLPRLVVRYPAHLRLDQPVWSGPFGESELAGLLDSPQRQEILRRLAAGQTAVWIMLDSGDSAMDDVAATALERELLSLKETLKLPELTDSPDDVIQAGPPLRVEFSLLRVRRDDPSEQPLVAMLLGCEADLATLSEPIVFPVFGRTRALLPLVGEGISPENIRSSAVFLAGACSCQVKELNPGFDLLTNANWNDLLSWAKSPALATGDSSLSRPEEPELVTIPVGSKAKSIALMDSEVTGSTTTSTRASNPKMTIMVCIAMAGIALVVLFRKR